MRTEVSGDVTREEENRGQEETWRFTEEETFVRHTPQGREERLNENNPHKPTVVISTTIIDNITITTAVVIIIITFNTSVTTSIHSTTCIFLAVCNIETHVRSHVLPLISLMATTIPIKNTIATCHSLSHGWNARHYRIIPFTCRETLQSSSLSIHSLPSTHYYNCHHSFSLFFSLSSRYRSRHYCFICLSFLRVKWRYIAFPCLLLHLFTEILLYSSNRVIMKSGIPMQWAGRQHSITALPPQIFRKLAQPLVASTERATPQEGKSAVSWREKTYSNNDKKRREKKQHTKDTCLGRKEWSLAKSSASVVTFLHVRVEARPGTRVTCVVCAGGCRPREWWTTNCTVSTSLNIQ